MKYFEQCTSLYCCIVFLIYVTNAEAAMFGSGEESEVEIDEKMYLTLSNGVKLPAIGLGLGNVAHEDIPELLSVALSQEDNLGYELIDTARASRNERIIGESINKATSKLRKKKNDKIQIHIVTKVWYTHLGYERTKISVKESVADLTDPLKNNKNVDVHVHVLIHWPQCYFGIEWMRCIEEEDELPQYIKDAGPSPLDSKFSFLATWRAFEDLYNEKIVSSIGVSNFEQDDLYVLMEAARIKPHLFQGNLEMTSALTPYLEQHRIQPQMYGLLQTLTTQKPVLKVGVARRHLVTLSDVLSNNNTGNSERTAASSLILSYMVQSKYSVMVRTSNREHLRENSPRLVQQVPEFSSGDQDRLKFILDSISFHWNEEEENDLDSKIFQQVHVNFYNRGADDVSVYWVNPETEEKIQVLEELRPGQHSYIASHPGHIFAAHDSAGTEVKKFNVVGNYGDSEWFAIDPLFSFEL